MLKKLKEKKVFQSTVKNAGLNTVAQVICWEIWQSLSCANESCDWREGGQGPCILRGAQWRSI